ncbi:unnamed protein product [Caretta caretta]
MAGSREGISTNSVGIYYWMRFLCLSIGYIGKDESALAYGTCMHFHISDGSRNLGVLIAQPVINLKGPA